MSGVSVIWYLLKSNAGVIAVAPAARIKAGNVKLDTAFPAISVTQISSMRQNLIKLNETGVMHTDRVQVTVFCKDATGSSGYSGLKTLLNLCLTACASQRATINSVVVDSIAPDIEGPDFEDLVTGVYSRSRDFIVRWTA